MNVAHYITNETSFAVLGLGQFGMTIAEELCENDYHVLCCDKNPKPVHKISSVATNAVQADISDLSVLDSLGIENYDVVIIGFSEDFETELLTTMVLKEKKVPFILAKASGVRQKKILQNVGANRVVMPDVEMGHHIVQKFMINDPMEYIYLSNHYEVIEIAPHKDWIGKSLRVLDLRKNNDINVLAIIRNEKPLDALSPSTIIQEKDTLVALQMHPEGY